MTLPPDFQFSQNSLQAYVDCPRRFQLRYIRRLAWPAIEAEPVLDSERYLQQGAAFHHLVHQHVLGIPAERLDEMVIGQDLRRWWRNYLDGGPADLPLSRYPEIVLSTPLAGHRIVARYDLIAVQAGRRSVIVDWKTSRKRSERRWLAERLQTRVYPYLLVQAGSQLNGGRPLEPEQVEMVYWFADFPADPERFAYGLARHEENGDNLAALIEEIRGLEESEFPLTPNVRRCRYCPYRSLCLRGIQAGRLDEAEDEGDVHDDLDFSLDLEQIAEIEY